MLLFRQKVGSGTVCVHGLCLCLTLNEPMGTRDPSPSPFLLSLFLPPPHSTLLFYLHALWLSLFPPLLPAPNNTRADLFVTLRAWEIPVPAIPQATHSICFQPPETKNRGPTLDQVCSTRLSQQACHYLEKEINLQIAPPHTHIWGGFSPAPEVQNKLSWQLPGLPNRCDQHFQSHMCPCFSCVSFSS